MSLVSAPSLPAFSRPLCWLIGVGGIIVLSPDSLLLRLTTADSNAVVTLRALFSSLSLLLVIAFIPALRRGFRWKPILIYGVFYALGLICFPLSILNTHVANTLVIISAAPMVAAVGAFIFLRERTRLVTWLAAATIFFGMGGIFASNLSGDGLYGDAMALLVAVSLAATSIVVRCFPQTAIYPGLIVGGIITTLLFGGDVNWGAISGHDIIILAVDGAIVMSLSFLLILTAARGLPPAELNLLFLLEAILGPLWVWLILHEVPPLSTVSAGVLILTVLLLHGIWLIKTASRQRQPLAEQ